MQIFLLAAPCSCSLACTTAKLCLWPRVSSLRHATGPPYPWGRMAIVLASVRGVTVSWPLVRYGVLSYHYRVGATLAARTRFFCRQWGRARRFTGRWEPGSCSRGRPRAPKGPKRLQVPCREASQPLTLRPCLPERSLPVQIVC
jgi:hypothetical protein